MKENGRLTREYLWLIAAMILISVGNLYFGRAEFGGYDLSVLIDSGWRVMNGQVPTQSFICTLPPSFYLLADIAFRIFGVHWLSLLLSENVLYLLLTLLGLRLCFLLGVSSTEKRERYFPWIYVAAQSVLILSVNHLWHSTTASGSAAYAVLATYTLHRLASGRHRRELLLHVALAFIMLILSKPNTSWSALVLCVLSLLIEKRLRRPLLLALGISLLSSTLLLAAFRISPFNAFDGYLGLSGRLLPRSFLTGFRPNGGRVAEVTLFLTYLVLSVAAWPLLRTLRSERFRRDLPITDLLGLGAILVAVIGLGTNWDIKIVDTAPLYVGAMILSASTPERFRLLTRPLAYSVGLLFILALGMGIARVRMIEVGPWAGSSFGPMVELRDPFFGKFRGRQDFENVLAESDSVVNKSSRKKIFFGPRMEFLYARDGLPSPVHLPIWWHPGTSYPTPSELGIDRVWEDDSFDVLIFAKDDRTRFPKELLSYINGHYDLDAGSRAIDVFYLR